MHAPAQPAIGAGDDVLASDNPRVAGLPLTPAAEFLLDLMRRQVPRVKARKPQRSH
jgi:hypothetical protein